ncbi:MAG: putative sulfate exporter family transporter [Spirochaetales bacterium]|nr:putative sulfate exporter family transporter [Spirochaetales bacterium]
MKKLLKSLFGTEKVLTVIPGTVVAVAVMLLSLLAARYLGEFFKARFNLQSSPVSTFLLAIILGILLRNIIKFPKIFEPGFKFCVAKLLRLGIIFLGIRLSILAIAKIGLVAVVVVVICITAGIVLASLYARIFKVSNRLGTLIAAGTAICGVSAIVATAPTIGAREEETAYAISTITIFGLLATLVYPYLVELVLRLNLGQAGIFLGTAVHDTSQVTGAAFIYDQIWNREVSRIAITTKLVRNTFMMAVIPILSVMYGRRNSEAVDPAGGDPAGGARRVNVLKLFPTFVLGFLAFAVFRSIGDAFTAGQSGRFLFWGTPESWTAFYSVIKEAATYLLSIAIAAAGLSTQFSKLKQLTIKPFLIGLMAAVSVGLISFILVQILRGPINALLPA